MKCSCRRGRGKNEGVCHHTLVLICHHRSHRPSRFNQPPAGLVRLGFCFPASWFPFKIVTCKRVYLCITHRERKEKKRTDRSWLNTLSDFSLHLQCDDDAIFTIVTLQTRLFPVQRNIRVNAPLLFCFYTHNQSYFSAWINLSGNRCDGHVVITGEVPVSSDGFARQLLLDAIETMFLSQLRCIDESKNVCTSAPTLLLSLPNFWMISKHLWSPW